MKFNWLKRLAALCLVIALCASLAACSSNQGDGESTPTPDAGAETPSGSEKTEVWIALSMNPSTLDLHKTTSLGCRQMSIGSLWERLLTLDANGEATEELCESYQMSEDATTFTFYLRQGVKFHDGSEMTADDVVASMNRWIESYGAAQTLVGDARFEKVDDYTVKIAASTPILTLPDMIAGATQCALITTAEACSDLTEEGYLKNYIGTGPYQFTEWVQDQYIRMDKFEDYVPYGTPGTVDGMAGYKAPTIPTLYFTYVKDVTTRIAGLQTGQYDLIYSLNSDNFDMINNTDGLSTYKEEAGTLVLLFNKAQGLGADANFRKAVNAALSMDDIMTVGYGSFYALGSCYMDECNGPWLTDAGSEYYNQANQELAKEYLAASSYQEGDVFTIYTTNENNRDSLALVVAAQLEEIGITCDVQAYDYPTMNSYVQDPTRCDAYVMSYSSVPLPTMKMYFDEGPSYWATDATFRDYLAQFNQATTREEAIQIWQTIQAYCWEEYLPIVNFGHYQECYAWNSDVLDNVIIYNNAAYFWNASIK